ncbi:PhnE/PtxC family ABC transporter permease [Acidaminococcus timonensis]|uniref:PhnE/PtxC family ABC transporter permease n=1 Tax=Acidaminococcus timonensis TaxID=1871002 RepID=UPI00307B6D7B
MKIRWRKRWLLLLLLAAAWQETGASLLVLAEGGSRFLDILEAMVPPDPRYVGQVLYPLAATIRMSVLGSVLGTLLGFMGALLANRWTDPCPFLRVPFKLQIQLLRTVPALILALFCTFLVGLGTLAGTLALTVYAFGVMTRLGYEDMETADWKGAQALAAAGSGRGKAFFRAILPKVLPGYLSNALYLWEANVRQAAILGYVGAGGIGLLLNERLAWRAYSQVGTILLLLYGVVLASEMCSELLRQGLAGKWRPGQKIRRALWAGGLLVLFWALGSVEPMGGTGLKAAGGMVSGLLHPDLSMVQDLSREGVLYLLWETFCMALLGTLGGAVLAGALSSLSSFRLLPVGVAVVPRLLLLAIRTVPVFVYGLLWIRVTGPGPFAGVLTLMLCSIGLLARRFLNTLEEIAPGPYLAYEATGCGRARAFWRGLLPQLEPGWGAAILYRLDVNLREAAILGLVGAGGIGTPLILALQHYKWQEAGALLWGLALLVIAMEALSEWLRKV